MLFRKNLHEQTENVNISYFMYVFNKYKDFRGQFNKNFYTCYLQV